MKNLIKLEELAMFLFCIGLLLIQGFAWWWIPIAIVGPDAAMVGYLVNDRTGAGLYNLFHHKGIALILYATGFVVSQPLLQAIGLTLFAHASMDRIFGFGLKYGDSFKHTHLGRIGEPEESAS